MVRPYHWGGGVPPHWQNLELEHIYRDGAVTATSVSILDRDKVASDRGKKMQTRYDKFYFLTATRKEKLHDTKLTLPD